MSGSKTIVNMILDNSSYIFWSMVIIVAIIERLISKDPIPPKRSSYYHQNIWIMCGCVMSFFLLLGSISATIYQPLSPTPKLQWFANTALLPFACVMFLKHIIMTYRRFHGFQASPCTLKSLIPCTIAQVLWTGLFGVWYREICLAYLDATVISQKPQHVYTFVFLFAAHVLIAIVFVRRVYESLVGSSSMKTD